MGVGLGVHRGGLDGVDQRHDVAGRVLGQLHGGVDGPAGLVAQHHDQARIQYLGGVLDRTVAGLGHHLAGGAGDEQVPDALVEDDLVRYPAIGAADDGGEGLLAEFHVLQVRLGLARADGLVLGETAVSIRQFLQRVVGVQVGTVAVGEVPIILDLEELAHPFGLLGADAGAEEEQREQGEEGGRGKAHTGII